MASDTTPMTTGTRRLRQRWLRRWRRSDLRLALRRRRFRVTGLAPVTRVTLALGAAYAVLAGVVLFLESRGHFVLVPVTDTVGRIVSVRPVVTVVAVFTGLAVTQAALAALTSTARGWRRALLTALLTLMCTATPVGLLEQLALVDSDYDGGVLLAGPLMTIRIVSWLAVALGLVALVGLILDARSRARPVAAWLAVAAAGAGPLALLAGWLVTRLGDAGYVGIRSTSALPGTLRLSSVVETGLENVVLTLAGAAMAFTLWQVAQGARAARDTGSAAAVLFASGVRRVHEYRGIGGWPVLAGLLALKLAWVGAGLTGRLPRWLGGGLSPWTSIREDGVVAWTVAGAVAVAAVLWLLAGTPAPEEGQGVRAGYMILIAVLVLPEVAYQSLALLTQTGAGNFVDLAIAVETYQPWAPVAAAVVAVSAAAVPAVRRRAPSMVVLLGLFAGWVALRLPGLLSDLVQYPWYPWDLGMVGEATSGPRSGWVGVASIDLAVTIAFLALSAAAIRQRTRVRIVPVVVIVSVLTVVTYPALLLPDLLASGLGTYLGFAFPVAYRFLADAEDLNRDVDRDRRVLALATLTLLAVTVGVLRGGRGGPEAENDLVFGGTLLAVPVLAASLVCGLRRATRPGLT